MSQEEGQAQEQPFDVNAAALSIADGMFPDTPEEAPEPAAQETETDEAAPQEQTEAEAQAEEIRKHKLKVKAEGGVDEEVEVDDNELKSGYMRQRDYQRKTAELARERESVRERIKAETEPVLSRYEQQLQIYEKAVWQALAPEVEKTDWNTLARENPAEWAAKMQSMNNVNSVLQAIKGEQEKIAQMRQQQYQQQLQESIQKAVEVLQNDIPGWNNEVYANILKAGTQYGFKQEELSNVTDPRVIKVLNDARKYQELQKAKPAVEKKVASVPKVMKPGTTERGNQNADGKKQALSQLRKSGRQDDAVAFALNAGLV